MAPAFGKRVGLAFAVGVRQARLQFPLMLKDGNAVQRAVQNKLHFLVAVQNEPVASWMENFLDHKHLKMIKMTDYHCKACYHGIDGLTCNWREYLQKLEGTSEQTIHVQYTPGVSEVESLRNANYSYTNVFGQEPPWAQASASRRQNPYLKENNGMPKIEFTEVVKPKEILQSLHSIATRIVEEFEEDLSHVREENEYIRLLHKERNIFKSANSSFEPLPVAWKQQLKGTLQEPTPLRQASKDLLMRLLTKTAVLEVLVDMSQDSKESKHYQWMKTYVGKWMQQFDSAASVKVDVSFMEELLQQPFRVSEKEGKMEVVDPLYISEKIFDKRLDVAARWTNSLGAARAIFNGT
ncbi:hypothetical protein GUITHDRAFT_120315 [Guillardia theta CCMP2712]|uniref:Uncharacterized protein n=1 Tax=Guillardia theta (strain CCMP2712) TaxID=905079 RepID=L1IBA8_GUITC|nr:hypothetical protein GUITHDRAFT_120315 [Guillardia theta CCMP2712]EKX33513.1 hypothetical protein GUITHDRAFT_120315 [Guillardia theta CCMP2712]|eukprot:XP_005820493.1 hypothetical protein GUITHDRAFT_120315 [Guillardia theta CCMP2712]